MLCLSPGTPVKDETYDAFESVLDGWPDITAQPTLEEGVPAGGGGCGQASLRLDPLRGRARGQKCPALGQGTLAPEVPDPFGQVSAHGQEGPPGQSKTPRVFVRFG